jgi:hypothetical protein
LKWSWKNGQVMEMQMWSIKTPNNCTTLLRCLKMAMTVVVVVVIAAAAVVVVLVVVVIVTRLLCYVIIHFFYITQILVVWQYTIRQIREFVTDIVIYLPLFIILSLLVTRNTSVSCVPDIIHPYHPHKM